MRTSPSWALPSLRRSRRTAGRRCMAAFNATVAELCAVLIYLPLRRAVTARLLALGAFGCRTLLSAARSGWSPADWLVVVCRMLMWVSVSCQGRCAGISGAVLTLQCLQLLFLCPGAGRQRDSPVPLFGVSFIPLCILELKTVGKWHIIK